jgi:hypothetical protein
MDRVTKSLMETFREEQSLGQLEEALLFEYFADYCVVSDAYEDEFDISDVHVGGEGDLNQDGLAIIVNGSLVTSVEQAEDLLAINNFLDVRFIFVQAKTSSSFSGEQIAAFIDGVDEFFADEPTLPMSEELKSLRKVMTWIYDHSVKFTRARPTCEMHFVTTGKWNNDANLVGKIGKRVKNLEATGLFERVTMKSLGAEEIQASYRRSKNNVSVEFSFVNRVTLPEIRGIAESYLGVLPLAEYIRIVSDPEGNIRKQLFTDNVRDYQGENPVNSEIRSTLDSVTGQERFAVLNNGVTLVARGLRITGNRFHVTDFQIVNGCQTSHVLFNARAHLGENVHVPLKVIATSDEDIINSIITATNRQTQVTDEDLYALNSLQKNLEALYVSYPDKKKLFYERRSKQYSSVAGVEKVRIVGKTQQIKAFAAMFLDDPHRAARYYADLKSLVGTKIFNIEHKLEPYYASAFAYYKLEFLFRNGALPVAYKPARFHLLMAFRHIVAGPAMPAMTSNRVQAYTTTLCETLWSDQKATTAFQAAIRAIDVALDGAPCSWETVKTQTFSDAVKAAVAK